MIGVLKSKGVPVLWVGLPVVSWPQGDRRHAVPGFALSRRGRQGRHHLCRCLGRLCRRGRPLPGERPGLRRSDPTAALFRRRVFHQGRRAQARALCRARDHAAVGGAFRADRVADRTGDARRQCAAGSAGAASAGRTDPSLGRLLGRQGSIARRSRVAAGCDRCASCTGLVKGEPLSAPAGRADDFAWPRREIERERPRGRRRWQRHRPMACATLVQGDAGGIAKVKKASPLGVWLTYPHLVGRPTPTRTINQGGFSDLILASCV